MSPGLQVFDPGLPPIPARWSTCTWWSRQRNLSVGKETVGRLLDRLQEVGVVGPSDGANPRTVLVPAEALESVLERIRGGAR